MSLNFVNNYNQDEQQSHHHHWFDLSSNPHIVVNITTKMNKISSLLSSIIMSARHQQQQSQLNYDEKKNYNSTPEILALASSPSAQLEQLCLNEIKTFRSELFELFCCVVPNFSASIDVNNNTNKHNDTTCFVTQQLPSVISNLYVLLEEMQSTLVNFMMKKMLVGQVEVQNHKRHSGSSIKTSVHHQNENNNNNHASQPPEKSLPLRRQRSRRSNSLSSSSSSLSSTSNNNNKQDNHRKTQLHCKNVNDSRVNSSSSLSSASPQILVNFLKNKKRKKLMTMTMNRNNDDNHKILSKDKENSTDDDDLTENKNRKSEDSPRSSSIPREWIIPTSSIKNEYKWSNIIGATEAVEALQQAVVLPMKFPELFLIRQNRLENNDDDEILSCKNDDRASNNVVNDNEDDDDCDDEVSIMMNNQYHNKKSTKSSCSRRCFFPWTALLLHGPVGTGKTQLAYATAVEANAMCLISVSAADLLSKWVGESEKAVRKLFTLASTLNLNHDNNNDTHTVVIFLDEIDALCSNRGSSGETEAARRIKTEFLIQAQKIKDINLAAMNNNHNNNNNCNSNNVLVLAATNFPWDLDSAFRRRFDQFIYVGLPDAESRFRILCQELSCVRFNNNNKQQVETKTETKTLNSFRLGNYKAGCNDDDENNEDDLVQEQFDGNTCNNDDRHTNIVVSLNVPSDSTLTIDDVHEFASSQKLEGYSGSDLKAIAKHTLMNPIRRLQRATHFWYDPSISKFVPCSSSDNNNINSEKKIFKMSLLSGGSIPSSIIRANSCIDEDNNNLCGDDDNVVDDVNSSNVTKVQLHSGNVQPFPLSKEDLECAFNFYPKSSTREQIQRYEIWNQEHR